MLSNIDFLGRVLYHRYKNVMFTRRDGVMKRTSKKFLSMLFTTSLLLGMSMTTFAGGMMSSFFGTDVVVTIGTTNAGMVSMVSDVLGFLQFAGFAIAVGMTIYAGMKYMMSAANEKAELKESSIRLVTGAIIVAGVSGLFPLIWKAFETLPD